MSSPYWIVFLRTPNSVGNLEKIEWFKKKREKSSFVALPSALVLIDIWLKKKKNCLEFCSYESPVLSLIWSRTNRNLHRSLVRCRIWNSNQTTDFESYVKLLPIYTHTHTHPCLNWKRCGRNSLGGEWNKFWKWQIHVSRISLSIPLGIVWSSINFIN